MVVLLVVNFLSMLARPVMYYPVLKQFNGILGGVLNLLATYVIVFVFLFGRMIGSRDENTREIAVQETTFETKIMQIDDEVIPPDSALLEIDITVKANNLQIRQKPDADSAIVATVQRGAKLTQLSEPESNWVFVRLADGKTVGYAYADSLFLV